MKNFAYIQKTIEEKYDIVSLETGNIIDTIEDISNIKFYTKYVINLEENGYT